MRFGEQLILILNSELAQRPLWEHGVQPFLWSHKVEPQETRNQKIDPRFEDIILSYLWSSRYCCNYLMSSALFKCVCNTFHEYWLLILYLETAISIACCSMLPFYLKVWFQQHGDFQLFTLPPSPRPITGRDSESIPLCHWSRIFCFVYQMRSSWI